MNDLLDVLTSGISANVDIKKTKNNVTLTSPILYSSSDNPQYSFIVDKHISSREVSLLKKAIEKHKIEDYQILYALQVILTPKDLKKTLWKQYRDYKWDYTKYIPINSKIISFGRSLFSITRSNDLDCSLIGDDENTSSKKKETFSIVQGFYDTILWKTSFYDPLTKCQVFPVDGWEDLIDKENGLFKSNFEYWFFNKQIYRSRIHNSPLTKIKKLNRVFVENPNQFLLEKINDKITIGFDTETKGLDCFSNDGKIICVTISYDGYTGYYLKWDDIDTSILANYLKHKSLIGSNLKYDVKWTSVKGNIPIDYFNIAGDTVLLQHLINEMMRKGLKSGTYLYTPYGGYDYELDKYLEAHPEIKNDYSKLPFNLLFDYATIDPCMSLQVHKACFDYLQILDKRINGSNPYGYSLEKYYKEIVCPSVCMFSEMEIHGMYIDKDILREESKKLQEEIIEIKKDILKDIGEENNISFILDDEEETDDFSVMDLMGGVTLDVARSYTNISSTDQLGKKILELGWRIDEYNEKGIPKTGETQLKEWEKQGYTLATKILKYRERSKILTTYVGIEKDQSGIYKWLHDNGKLHPIYNAFGTLSHRHRGSAPNPQNFISHGEKAKIARAFITTLSKYYAFLSTDYSGLQLRLIAMVSKDKEMVKTFKYEDGDLHMRTAYNVMLKYIMKIPSIEEAKKLRKEGSDEIKEKINDYRYKAKSQNFSICFGSSAVTIMEQSIKPEWKENDLDLYIKSNELETILLKHYKNIVDKKYSFIRYSENKKENMLNAKYYTVASDVREKFFNSYTGLNDWIEGTRLLAKKQGYVVSVYGCIRRLPYLLIDPENEDNKDVNKGKYHNLLNICLNSPIQNMEAIVMTRSLLQIWKITKERNYKSFLFGTIHDAKEAQVYIGDNEWKDYIKLTQTIATKDYPEYDGIPLEVESNIANFYGRNELWDMGRKVSIKDLDTFVL